MNQCTTVLRSHFDEIHKNTFLMRAVAFGKHRRIFACDDVIRVSVHCLHIKSRLVNFLVVKLVPVCNCVAVSQCRSHKSLNSLQATSFTPPFRSSELSLRI